MERSEHYRMSGLDRLLCYSGLNYSMEYWRTSSQYEVDLILGGGKVAIEIKSTTLARDRHLNCSDKLPPIIREELIRYFNILHFYIDIMFCQGFESSTE